jgi:hypothetical protein
VKLYSVTVEFETVREAQMVVIDLYLAANPEEAAAAAITHAEDAYAVAAWAPARVTNVSPFAGTFPPVRFATLREDGWRETETNRPLEVRYEGD